jgi:hypothetical protein
MGQKAKAAIEKAKSSVRAMGMLSQQMFKHLSEIYTLTTECSKAKTALKNLLVSQAKLPGAAGPMTKKEAELRQQILDQTDVILRAKRRLVEEAKYWGQDKKLADAAFDELDNLIAHKRKARATAAAGAKTALGKAIAKHMVHRSIGDLRKEQQLLVDAVNEAHHLFTLVDSIFGSDLLKARSARGPYDL